MSCETLVNSLIMLRTVLFCLATLYYTQEVRGDHPLQTILSRLECYKFTQEGCDTDFTDAHPDLSRSADNTSVAATRFYLFTPDNPDDPELMHKCGGGLPPDTKFNPACKTEIFFPGFVSGVCHFAIYRELKNERLKCGCYNVILVEWTWGNSFDLMLAAENMKIVGKQVAVVVRGLKEKYGLTDEDFICTGHSLGAHGCAFVGQDEPIAVINGLDPAGVAYWEGMPLNERLDPGDATRCVQVTHCNAGQCLPNYFGVNFTCGTKDIWYNDGLRQPACHKQTLISFLTGDFVYGLISLSIPGCPHLQCLEYYKTSICSKGCNQIAVECDNAKTFLSGQCRDCGENGQKCDVAGEYSCDCNEGSFKSYYLKTDINCPYCDNSGINVNGYSCPALKKKKCSKLKN